MKLAAVLLSSLALLSGCSEQLMSMGGDRPQNTALINELRLELADVKHALHSTKVELQLLEEKHRNQDAVITSFKSNQGQNKTLKPDALSLQLSNVERRLAQLEKGIEKTSADLKQLTVHATQTNASLTQYRDRIQSIEGRVEEVVKLKSTLNSISQAIQKKSPTSEKTSETYRVKSGDSLDKIAKSHSTTAENLKKINGLDSDRITVGQEIKLHD
jgi:LysM repeat protein